jgi:hypothetical protein
MEPTHRRPLRHLLVVANATCTGAELFRELRERADETETQVLIVAPALTTRLRYWMSDEDAGTAAAQRRLAVSLERCAAAGISARGALGDADPLAAIDDAVRAFHPDEIIIATHPPGHSNWLERGVVAQARARFGLPITHIEVDSAHDASQVVDVEVPDPRAPAHERHRRRDVLILVAAVVLFVVSSVLTGVFYATGVPTWLVGTWFIVFDLGLKLAIFIALWMLFQRRPRADRLDF